MVIDRILRFVSPNRIAAIAMAAFGALICASVAQDLILYSTTPPLLSRKIWFLDVDVERSFYTWLSSITLYSIGGLLLLIGMKERLEGQRFSAHWLLLGCIFVLLSLDESVSLHEKISQILSIWLKTTGTFYFVWTVPALVLLGIGFAFYVPFLLSLPPRTSFVMVVSGLIYVMGAVGMEIVAGGYVEQFGVETLTYRAMTNLEEALEGIGLVIFLWCVLQVAFEKFGRRAVFQQHRASAILTSASE